MSSSARDAEFYSDYMAYYRERNVEAIHGGIIAMRRRSGHNWMLLEEISQTPKGPFGESVLRAFAARDFLQARASDDQFLGATPRLSADARLGQVLRQGEQGWKRESLTLRLVEGFE